MPGNNPRKISAKIYNNKDKRVFLKAPISCLIRGDNINIKIVTDSGCDLPRDIIRDLDIDILPLHVYDGEKEYLDRVDISPRELYQGMRQGKFYRTSQASPAYMVDLFEQYAKEGRQLIYISFSSGLSGQFQTANLLANDLKNQYKKFNMQVIDSLSASSGLGLIVYEAAKMAKNGESLENICNYINLYIIYMNHVIIVDSMDYLYKGGRISPVQALTGGLLNIKPILGLDQEGRLEFQDKIRGRKKLLRRVADIIEEKGGDLSHTVVGVVYGDNKELAEEIIQLISRYKPKEILVENIGVSIAAHSGPDIIGITFLDKNYKKH